MDRVNAALVHEPATFNTADAATGGTCVDQTVLVKYIGSSGCNNNALNKYIR